MRDIYLSRMKDVKDIEEVKVVSSISGGGWCTTKVVISFYFSSCSTKYMYCTYC